MQQTVTSCGWTQGIVGKRHRWAALFVLLSYWCFFLRFGSNGLSMDVPHIIKLIFKSIYDIFDPDV